MKNIALDKLSRCEEQVETQQNQLHNYDLLVSSIHEAIADLTFDAEPPTLNWLVNRLHELLNEFVPEIKADDDNPIPF